MNNYETSVPKQPPINAEKENAQPIKSEQTTLRIPPEQVSIFENKKKITSGNKSVKNQPKTKKEGDLLEYRLKRLLFAMGYFPKVGVIIKTLQDEQADMITDLDVYGIYLHKNFASKTIWADCKSGQARPLERISWINGVKNTIKIDDVIFVKGNVRTTTKQYARTSGIQILDLKMINRLESDFAINANDWRGSWNPETQLNKLGIFQKINIPNNEIFKKIGNFISSGYWTLNHFSQIKKTITALRQLSEAEQLPLSKEQNDSIRWTIYELVNFFVLSTLNICREIYYFYDTEKKEILLEGLISGEISFKKRAEIVEATYKVAYSIIQKQIPDFNIPIQIPSLGMTPPRYFESFYDLVLRITNNPLGYHDILRFLDFILMEYDLQSKIISETTLRTMFKDYDSLIISAKTILHFICSTTSVSRDIFQLIR